MREAYEREPDMAAVLVTHCASNAYQIILAVAATCLRLEQFPGPCTDWLGWDVRSSAERAGCRRADSPPHIST